MDFTRLNVPLPEGAYLGVDGILGSNFREFL